MNKHLNVFKDSFVNQNPLVLVSAGLCSALGVTTHLVYALTLGLCITLILVLTEFVLSLTKKIITGSISIIISVLVIATFTTIVQLFLQTYFANIYKALGIFLPLVIMNCTILSRSQSFSLQNNVVDSVLDGFAVGLAYIVVLVCIAFIREFLGLGTIFAGTPITIKIIPEDYCINILKSPSGGFLIFGLFAALSSLLQSKSSLKTPVRNGGTNV